MARGGGRILSPPPSSVPRHGGAAVPPEAVARRGAGELLSPPFSALEEEAGDAAEADAAVHPIARLSGSYLMPLAPRPAPMAYYPTSAVPPSAPRDRSEAAAAAAEDAPSRRPHSPAESRVSFSFSTPGEPQAAPAAKAAAKRSTRTPRAVTATVTPLRCLSPRAKPAPPPPPPSSPEGADAEPRVEVGLWRALQTANQRLAESQGTAHRAVAALEAACARAALRKAYDHLRRWARHRGWERLYRNPKRRTAPRSCKLHVAGGKREGSADDSDASPRADGKHAAFIPMSELYPERCVPSEMVRRQLAAAQRQVAALQQELEAERQRAAEVSCTSTVPMHDRAQRRPPNPRAAPGHTSKARPPASEAGTLRTRSDGPGLESTLDGYALAPPQNTPYNPGISTASRSRFLPREAAAGIQQAMEAGGGRYDDAGMTILRWVLAVPTQAAWDETEALFAEGRLVDALHGHLDGEDYEMCRAVLAQKGVCIAPSGGQAAPSEGQAAPAPPAPEERPDPPVPATRRSRSSGARRSAPLPRVALSCGSRRAPGRSHSTPPAARPAAPTSPVLAQGDPPASQASRPQQGSPTSHGSRRPTADVDSVLNRTVVRNPSQTSVPRSRSYQILEAAEDEETPVVPASEIMQLPKAKAAAAVTPLKFFTLLKAPKVRGLEVVRALEGVKGPGHWATLQRRFLREYPKFYQGSLNAALASCLPPKRLEDARQTLLGRDVSGLDLPGSVVVAVTPLCVPTSPGRSGTSRGTPSAAPSTGGNSGLLLPQPSHHHPPCDTPAPSGVGTYAGRLRHPSEPPAGDAARDASLAAGADEDLLHGAYNSQHDVGDVEEEDEAEARPIETARCPSAASGVPSMEPTVAWAQSFAFGSGSESELASRRTSRVSTATLKPLSVEPGSTVESKASQNPPDQLAVDIDHDLTVPLSGAVPVASASAHAPEAGVNVQMMGHVMFTSTGGGRDNTVTPPPSMPGPAAAADDSLGQLPASTADASWIKTRQKTVPLNLDAAEEAPEVVPYESMVSSTSTKARALGIPPLLPSVGEEETEELLPPPPPPSATKMHTLLNDAALDEDAVVAALEGVTNADEWQHLLTCFKDEYTYCYAGSLQKALDALMLVSDLDRIKARFECLGIAYDATPFTQREMSKHEKEKVASARLSRGLSAVSTAGSGAASSPSSTPHARRAFATPAEKGAGDWWAKSWVAPDSAPQTPLGRSQGASPTSRTGRIRAKLRAAAAMRNFSSDGPRAASSPRSAFGTPTSPASTPSVRTPKSRPREPTMVSVSAVQRHASSPTFDSPRSASPRPRVKHGAEPGCEYVDPDGDTIAFQMGPMSVPGSYVYSVNSEPRPPAQCMIYSEVAQCIEVPELRKLVPLPKGAKSRNIVLASLRDLADACGTSHNIVDEY